MPVSIPCGEKRNHTRTMPPRGQRGALSRLHRTPPFPARGLPGEPRGAVPVRLPPRTVAGHARHDVVHLPVRKRGAERPVEPGRVGGQVRCPPRPRAREPAQRRGERTVPALGSQGPPGSPPGPPESSPRARRASHPPGGPPYSTVHPSRSAWAGPFLNGTDVYPGSALSAPAKYSAVLANSRSGPVPASSPGLRLTSRNPASRPFEQRGARSGFFSPSRARSSGTKGSPPLGPGRRSRYVRYQEAPFGFRDTHGLSPEPTEKSRLRGFTALEAAWFFGSARFEGELFWASCVQ